MPLDLDRVRAQFPALAGDWVFLDNAGGSQTLETVADRVRDYLLTSDVQLGASYEVSRRAQDRVLEGQRAMARMVNAADPGEVILGPSTSALFRMLAGCFARTFQPGDEVVVTDCDHEANIGPWVDLERHGIRVRWWKLDPEAFTLDTAVLESLLTPRTRLVAVTHASNILGTVNPVREWADLVHRKGAILCVDGVAYAPHRRIDVRALDVDFYALSLYKVYGPHQAVLYGKREHLLGLPRQNHFFIAEDDIPYKFQPGNVNYELTWSAGAVLDYLESLGGAPEGETGPRLDVAFGRIARHEAEIGGRFLDYLATKPSVRVIGQSRMSSTRVPTVSFVVDGTRSSTIPPRTDAARIGIRWGDFYARRLIDALGLDGCDGVVRVSMVHYNTSDEVDRLIEALDPWL
jgi:cysteine desulfurase family protein (TIGR01976 family)